MTHNTKLISPLRRRMLEDMTLRKLSPKTQATCIRAVINFTRFIKRSPDTASAEDLRQYQLHLVEQGVASGNLNATITGLTFFFETTLERPEAMTKMSHVYEPRKLPVILGLEEVTMNIAIANPHSPVLSMITIIDVVMFTLFDELVDSARRLQGSRGSCQWCS